MNDPRDKNVITSYTDNRIGSGKYCECGHELTHEENRARQIGSIMCKHKKGSPTRR